MTKLKAFIAWIRDGFRGTLRAFADALFWDAQHDPELREQMHDKVRKNYDIFTRAIGIVFTLFGASYMMFMMFAASCEHDRNITFLMVVVAFMVSCLLFFASMADETRQLREEREQRSSQASSSTSLETTMMKTQVSNVRIDT